MKLHLKLAVVAALLAISTAAWGQAVVPSPKITNPLTIDEALAIAFAHNPELCIATAQVNKARGIVAEARARFLPTFGAQVARMYQGPAVNFTIPDGPSVPIRPPSTTSAQASVFLPLDISGRLHYGSQMAGDQFQISYLGLLRTSEQLIAQVKRSCYELLRASGQAETVQAGVDVAALRLKNTQSRFDAGTVPKFDVTTAQVDLANLNQQLIAARSRVEITRANLNRVLGIGIDSPTEVAKVDVPVDTTGVSIPDKAKTARAQRPEVKAQKIGVALSKTNVKLQRTGVLPSLGVSGAYDYSSMQAFSTSNLGWNVVATISVPIWDGGVTRAKVDQAHGDLQAATASLDQTELMVSQEVSAAALALEEAAKRTNTTAQSVALAEEALRLANVRYEAGIAVLVEVTNAESQLTQARFNLVNAQYDYAIALADLQRATSTQPELAKLRLIECSAVPKTAEKPAE